LHCLHAFWNTIHYLRALRKRLLNSPKFFCQICSKAHLPKFFYRQNFLPYGIFYLLHSNTNLKRIAPVWSSCYQNYGQFLLQNGTTHLSYINYHVKGEIPIVLHFQLYSTCYTALWINNCLKRMSVIKLATMTISIAIKCHHEINTLLSVKMNGTQRRTLVSPWRMHYAYCNMPKGTSSDIQQWKNQACNLSHCRVLKA